jgi:hypothetical protein
MMKVNKLLVFLFAIVALATLSLAAAEETITVDDLAGLEDMMKNGNLNDSTTAQEGADETEEQIREVIKQMGIDKQETITRETFKAFFTKLILQGEEVPEEEKAIFDKLIQRVADLAPESFPTKDISQYVEMSKITNILNDIMAESGIDPKMAMNDFENMGEGEVEGESEGDAQEEEQTTEKPAKIDL